MTENDAAIHMVSNEFIDILGKDFLIAFVSRPSLSIVVIGCCWVVAGDIADNISKLVPT